MYEYLLPSKAKTGCQIPGTRVTAGCDLWALGFDPRFSIKQQILETSELPLSPLGFLFVFINEIQHVGPCSGLSENGPHVSESLVLPWWNRNNRRSEGGVLEEV